MQGGSKQLKRKRSDIVQIMLCERKIQLDKEMKDMLDPTIGQDVMGSMKKEIHRMELRKTELQKLQEQYLKEMERAIEKRSSLAIKNTVQSSKRGVEMSEHQLKKAIFTLQRSITITEKESQATDRRIAELDEQRQQLAEEMEKLGGSCRELRDKEDELKLLANQLADRKQQLVILTAKFQKRAKRLDDLLAGTYRLHEQDPEKIDQTLSGVREKQQAILSFVNEVVAQRPELEQNFHKSLLYLSVEG